ncbi:hypothetical protein [Deinococcus soli (ex Cha et al. 2016)]|uniref:hypothetical protein n=1 Tax=Deinococcus soli (ex Cha et al. 2016) TaxID=1309411 RepID=UPI001664CDC7|nr:hypothetical protein [Deinococcus soli (ex Cha et al. 2016)]
MPHATVSSPSTPRPPLQRAPLPARPPQVQDDKLIAHLTQHGYPERAHLEFTARPGTPLGGPFAGPYGPGRRAPLLSDAELAEKHLTYLRAAYRTDPETRRLLDTLASLYAYGPNRLAIIADRLVVAENVVSAIKGLAGRLPPRVEE